MLRLNCLLGFKKWNTRGRERMIVWSSSMINKQMVIGNISSPPSIIKNTTSNVEPYRVNDAKLLSVKTFRQGDSVKVKVIKLSPVGVTVELVENKRTTGIILAQDVDLFSEKLNGKEITVNQIFDAFVVKVNENGKLQLSFRPIGLSRLLDVKEQVMNAIKQSPSGVLPVGDRSSIGDIALMFRGVSKHDFKAAVGKLFKEGLVQPGPHSVALMRDEDRKVPATHAMAHLEKAHFKPVKPDRTLFLGNLPQTASSSQLIASVEEEVGFDTVEEVRLAVNEVTGRSKNYAFVEFKTARDAEYALRKLRYVEVLGRRVSVRMSDRKVRAIKVSSDTPGSFPIEKHVKIAEQTDVDTSSSVLSIAQAEQRQQLTDGASGVYDISDERALAAPFRSAYDNDEEGDEEVDGVFTGDFELDPDFDPETEYYELPDDFDPFNNNSNDNSNSSSSSAVSLRRVGTSSRDAVHLQDEDMHDDVEEEEEEPEDYNDFELYRPREILQQPGNRRSRGRAATTTVSSSSSRHMAASSNHKRANERGGQGGGTSTGRQSSNSQWQR